MLKLLCGGLLSLRVGLELNLSYGGIFENQAGCALSLLNTNLACSIGPLSCWNCC